MGGLFCAAASASEMGWFGLSLSPDTDGTSLRSFTVVEVSPSSPAASAGLAAGDAVVEIEGMAVAGAQGAKSYQLMDAFQKPVGETLHLRVRRGSAIARDVSMVAVVKWEGDHHCEAAIDFYGAIYEQVDKSAICQRVHYFDHPFDDFGRPRPVSSCVRVGTSCIMEPGFYGGWVSMDQNHYTHLWISDLGVLVDGWRPGWSSCFGVPKGTVFILTPNQLEAAPASNSGPIYMSIDGGVLVLSASGTRAARFKRTDSDACRIPDDTEWTPSGLRRPGQPDSGSSHVE